MSHGWRVELDRQWDVLGPFPIHAREQHFLPSDELLSVSLPIPSSSDSNTTYLSSLPRSARASWTHTTADHDGKILISHPSCFQHVSVLRGWLTVYPPISTCHSEEDHVVFDPLLRVNLLRGAFFTILPPPTSTEREEHTPEWHMGNLYAMSRAPVQLVKLPVSPRRNMSEEGTRYEVIICGAYEIRLFGDPSSYNSPYPILDITLSVELEFPSAPLHTPGPTVLLPHSVTPHFAIGIGIRSIDSGESGCSSVSSLALTLLEPIRIAPTQTRIVPLCITLADNEYVSEKVKELVVELTCSRSTHVVGASQMMHADSDIVLIRGTYFFARSMVTAFILVPPKIPLAKPDDDGYAGGGLEHTGNEPILYLHGSGVDIVTQFWWADSFPRQKHAWIVIPQGRTEWGLDWHGPSAAEAFSAVTALSLILAHGPLEWRDWGFDTNTRVVLVGHSNGGQGAWYIAARWPDRVCGVIPAAGYIKSQEYVPWSMSRFSHFVDPFLRAVLETSLTPDDNDLFLSNLVGTPILALHGGADDNVPTWHTRELVGILKTWDRDADITYYEDAGRPHWYPEIFKSDCALRCISDSNHSSVRRQGRFTLTVATPHESGPMYGWRICALTWLVWKCHLHWSDGRVFVRTTNVSAFSLDLRAWLRRKLEPTDGREGTGSRELEKWHVIFIFDVDGDELAVEVENDAVHEIAGTILFARDRPSSSDRGQRSWKILPEGDTDPVIFQPRQRLQAILSSAAPLTLLISSFALPYELSAALRISYALRLYHSLDAQIVSLKELESLADIDEGEPLVQAWLERIGSAWRFKDGAWCFSERRKFSRPSSGIPLCYSFDTCRLTMYGVPQRRHVNGLERALRLFPIRTGVFSPDWIVVGERADEVGAAGVEGTGYACLFISSASSSSLTVVFESHG
ncbi:hypothetical protein EDC04DRAFT_2654078 [Pisolithus marmoratus]|nr:hypothetical protein EDC04DRAFT_2654078 [Pisolithus marmoratus]